MDLQEDLALQLARVSRAWRARLDDRLRSLGLTQARWVTLLQVSRTPEGVTQRELACLVGVERATIGRLLDGLEKQGLIERRAVAGDRRAYHVHLTLAAAPVLEQINEISRRFREELLADIPTEDLSTCATVMKHIGNRLEKYD